MPIKIILHNKGRSKTYSDPSDDPNFAGPTIEINVRKNIRGDFMIMDHADVDIVYSGKNHKVTAFAKNVNVNADLVYDAQNRLFQYLTKKGVVDPESVQGGSLYSSMEADVFKENEVQENQVVLFAIGRFIEQERPFFKWKEAFRDKMVNKYTDPDDENSTDLGDVPHGDRKGQIDPSGWLSGAAYQLYEGKEISPEDVEFAQRIETKNRELNVPSWALLNSGKLARIWDMPSSDMSMTVSWDGAKTWDGHEGMADIPISAIKQVVWYDTDQYAETAPAQEPLHIEVR